MDTSVDAASGWSDLDLDHDFGVTKQGLRFTISEVLARLLALNHERSTEEKAKGLHDKKAKSSGSRMKAAPATNQNLFADETGPIAVSHCVG